MFCICDPSLADLLAGKEEIMPSGREDLLFGGLLAGHLLALLAFGAWLA
jgi:hypothetical protein